MGDAVYDENASLLSNDNIRIRDVLFLEIKKDIMNFKKHDSNIDLLFKVSYYDTQNLYSTDNFLDVRTALIYNIRN